MTTYQQIRDNPSILEQLPPMVPLVCEACGVTYTIERKRVKFKYERHQKNYCSKLCIAATVKIHYEKSCAHCGANFVPNVGRKKFCCQSCAASFNNKNKKFGIRRSKLEDYIQAKLQEKYPSLEIHYNQKDAIGSELDIFIPSLKLAFELNGVFHYEPIFGSDKLNKIQANDSNKFQMCQLHGISLCIIDTSSQKYVKDSTSQKFLNIVDMIIEKNLAGSHKL